jgi:phage-related holin
MKLFNNLSMVIGGIGGILIYWLGGMDMFLEALLFAMVCDYITGIIKAIMNKNLSSK